MSLKDDSDVTIVNKKSIESVICSNPTTDNNSLSFAHLPLSHRQGESINNMRVSIAGEILNIKPGSNSSIKPSCNPITVLRSHFDAVRDIALSEDRKYLFSVSEDMLINVWDFQKALNWNKEIYEPSLTLRGHTQPIFSLTTQHNSNSNIYNIYTGGSEV